MSLSAIQDNLVKTNLVQQTQSRGDEVHRSQQIAQTTSQAEHDRQHDQVVLMTRSKEQHTINPDDQRERQEQEKKKKRNRDGEDSAEEKSAGEKRRDTGMHRINIVV